MTKGCYVLDLLSKNKKNSKTIQFLYSIYISMTPATTKGTTSQSYHIVNTKSCHILGLRP